MAEGGGEAEWGATAEERYGRLHPLQRSGSREELRYNGSQEGRYREESSPLYRSQSSDSLPPEYLSRSQWGASQSSLDRMRRGSVTSATNGTTSQHQARDEPPPVPALPPQAHQFEGIRPNPPLSNLNGTGRSQPERHHLHFAPDVKAPAPGLSTNSTAFPRADGYFAAQGGLGPEPVEGGTTPIGQRPRVGSAPGSGATTPAASDTEWDDAYAYDDDYDWDADEDLEGEARFEELSFGAGQSAHHRRKPLTRRFSPYTIIKWFLTTFLGNVLISIALLVPPIVLRYTGYYKKGDDPGAAHTRFVYDNVAAWCFWFSFNNLAAWGIHFLVELAPRIAVLIVHLVWGDVSEMLKGFVEVFHAAKGWIKPPIYAAMAWGSWAFMFCQIYNLRANDDPANNSRAPYTFRLYQVIALGFFVVLIFCIEKLVLLAISMNFHRVAYADRIKKVAGGLGILDKLKDYRPKRKFVRPNASRNPSTEHLTGHRSPWLASHGGFRTPTTPASGSPASASKSRWWVRKGATSDLPITNDFELTAKGEQSNRTSPVLSRIQTKESHSDTTVMPGGDALSRRGSDTASTLGKYISKRGASAAQVARAAMKDPVAVVGKKSGLGLDINSPKEAKRLARDIYLAFRADPKRPYLIPSDFFPAFSTQKAASSAFNLFDKDGNGDISKAEIKNTIMQIYKERRALARSLGDVQHAISRLDGILLGMAAIVLLFVALAVFGVDFSKALTSAYSLGLALAFIVKETAAQVFDAIIMVFCTHPFDTGDRIFMDNNGVEECLVVKRMGLLVTVFERWDGTEFFSPNALLGQKIITNLRRSDPQFENATLQMGWDTPLEKLTKLEEKMNAWLSTDEERRFAPSTACVIQKLIQMQYMEVTVGMTHCENWQNWGARWARRTAFHAALQHFTRELGITFYMPEMPIYYNPADLDRLPDSSSDDDGSDVRSPFSPGEEGDDDDDEPLTAVQASSAKPFERQPSVMGFTPPSASGTGMRRRKKLSNRKMMGGEA